MKEVVELITDEQIKAITEPYKIKILLAFESIDKPATVKQVADSMKEPPSKLYYHVKKMVEAGILELHHTEEINGILAKYYQPTAKTYDIAPNKSLKERKTYITDRTNILLSGCYNNLKSVIIGNLENIQESGENSCKYPCSISSSDMYLTDDEAKDFRNKLEKFMKEHSKRKNGDVKNKYYIFNTMAKIFEK